MFDALDPVMGTGDDPPVPFSKQTKVLPQKMLMCWLTYTTSGVHAAVRDNLKRVPLYSRKFDSIGPRNCPSIEAKVIKFPHHDRHQIFLEPEGYNTDEVYINGYNTGMPEDIQEAMIRNTPGLEKARIISLLKASIQNMLWERNPLLFDSQEGRKGGDTLGEKTSI